ncbi:toxin-antitoxin system YwqK family antitoxin [uncultured Psychroserpens sp.]|uniref:toxin-antitoxin system YwqK family antitoxin n=1 Tax=uncultured Psychroserpens sp. TaxID=255436 RepID=UPI00262DDDB9|nr:toxin-antitoxin system YwqK family antitoxin [uncultured Psychroserpens sp.]
MLTLTINTVSSHAQDPVNQLDENGKRHGLWKKSFHNTNQLRYSGQFFHGKEVDTFKFYTLKNGKSVLSGIKVFNKDNDIASVTFLSSKGKVISEGKMNGKLYFGKWVFYHNKSDSIMSVEHYNDQGQLHGEKTVYYENGQIAEISNYTNGKLEGESIWYSDKGVVLKRFLYENDELHGVSKYYDAEGVLLAEGKYQKGRKHGIWTYYEDGKLKETKDHTRRSKNPKKQ